MRNELLCVKSSMCSGTNTSLKIWKRLISFPVGRIQGDVIWCSRDPESKGSRVAGKERDQFRCWHLGSQRHRGKKSPSLAPQFMSTNARSKLQLRIIRKSTNWVEKPRRDWRWCNSIRLLHRSVQFWCLEWINEDGVQSLFEVSNSLIQKGIILTPWFQENGLMMTPCQWTQDKCGSGQQTWYPITTPESPGLTPITESELTASSDGTKPGKEDSFPSGREGRGIRWLSMEAPRLHAPPNGWSTAEWVAEGPPYPR